MKKTAGKFIIIMVLIMLANTFTGCELAAAVIAAPFYIVGGIVELGSASAAQQREEQRWQKMTPEEREQEEWQKMTPEEREWFEKMNKYKDVDTF